MTLKQLYLLNLAWDPFTILTVHAQSSLYGCCTLVSTYHALPEKVMGANVVYFVNDCITVSCKDV